MKRKIKHFYQMMINVDYFFDNRPSDACYELYESFLDSFYIFSTFPIIEINVDSHTNEFEFVVFYCLENWLSYDF